MRKHLVGEHVEAKRRQPRRRWNKLVCLKSTFIHNFTRFYKRNRLCSCILGGSNFCNHLAITSEHKTCLRARRFALLLRWTATSFCCTRLQMSLETPKNRDGHTFGEQQVIYLASRYPLKDLPHLFLAHTIVHLVNIPCLRSNTDTNSGLSASQKWTSVPFIMRVIRNGSIRIQRDDRSQHHLGNEHWVCWSVLVDPLHDFLELLVVPLKLLVHLLRPGLVANISQTWRILARYSKGQQWRCRG